MNPLREYICFSLQMNQLKMASWLVIGICVHCLSFKYWAPVDIWLQKNMGRNIYAFDFFIKIKTWNTEQNFVFVFSTSAKKICIFAALPSLKNSLLLVTFFKLPRPFLQSQAQLTG